MPHISYVPDSGLSPGLERGLQGEDTHKIPWSSTDRPPARAKGVQTLPPASHLRLPQPLAKLSRTYATTYSSMTHVSFRCRPPASRLLLPHLPLHCPRLSQLPCLLQPPSRRPPASLCHTHTVPASCLSAHTSASSPLASLRPHSQLPEIASPPPLIASNARQSSTETVPTVFAGPLPSVSQHFA